MSSEFIAKQMLALIDTCPSVSSRFDADARALALPKLTKFIQKAIQVKLVDFHDDLVDEQALTAYIDRLKASRSNPFPLLKIPMELPGAHTTLHTLFSVLNKTLSLLEQHPEKREIFFTNPLLPVDATLLCAQVIQFTQTQDRFATDYNYNNLSFSMAYGLCESTRLAAPSDLRGWNQFQLNMVWLHGLINTSSSPKDTFPDDAPLKLHRAVIGSPEDVTTALQKGANINEYDNMGDTPLHAAIQRGNIAMVRLLLSIKSPTQTIDINHPGCGNRPLHCAASLNRVDMIELLIAHGADVSLTNCIGMTALGIAIQCGHKKATQRLLKMQPYIIHIPEKKPAYT